MFTKAVDVKCLFFFFFSSRRRHTRSLCDWSSDVCSSDLAELRDGGALLHRAAERVAAREQINSRLVVDELVLLRAPMKLRRRLRPRMHDAGDAQPHGIERARIVEVDLHAVTAQPGVLVPRGH